MRPVGGGVCGVKGQLRRRLTGTLLSVSEFVCRIAIFCFAQRVARKTIGPICCWRPDKAVTTELCDALCEDCATLYKEAFRNRR